MNLVILFVGLVVIIASFILINWLVSKSNILISAICANEIDIIKEIRSKFSKLVYITNIKEFTVMNNLLSLVATKFYPTSSIIRPFETWMILVRRYYFKNQNNEIEESRNQEMMDDELLLGDVCENVARILIEIINLSGKLDSYELLPIRGHIWLCAWIHLLKCIS